MASRSQDKVLLIDMVALTPAPPHPKHERSSFRKEFLPIACRAGPGVGLIS